MKCCEIMDTEENIIETYLVDAIGRNEDVHSFIDLLSSINGNMTLSIDGKWGSGKTFFVKQTQVILDSLKPLKYSIGIIPPIWKQEYKISFLKAVLCQPL